MKSPLTRFSSVTALPSTGNAAPFLAGIECQPTRERSMSYLKPEHQRRVVDAYHAFKDVDGFAKVASLANIRANDGNLSIPLYVRGKSIGDEKGDYDTDWLQEAIKTWEMSSKNLALQINSLLSKMENDL